MPEEADRPDRRRESIKPKGWTNDFEFIQKTLLPIWLREFKAKNTGYGDDSGKLGVQGGFTDVWRKTLKLKRSVWDGQDVAEPEQELVKDMIGHLFLLWVDLVGEEQDKQTRPPAPIPPQQPHATGPEAAWDWTKR